MAKDHPTGKSGLYAAFLELETPEECYRFLQDVCSYAELSAMEQRYNIAEKAHAQAELHQHHGQHRRIQRHHQPGKPGAECQRQRRCAPCWKRKKLPTIKTELPHKPCRVPPVRYAAFIIQPGRQKSPRQRGTSIVFPHAAQMRRLHQKIREV